jgi:hypothetical protein
VSGDTAEGGAEGDAGEEQERLNHRQSPPIYQNVEE